VEPTLPADLVDRNRLDDHMHHGATCGARRSRELAAQDRHHSRRHSTKRSKPVGRRPPDLDGPLHSRARGRQSLELVKLSDVVIIDDLAVDATTGLEFIVRDEGLCLRGAGC
jgi:hypothetical protein